VTSIGARAAFFAGCGALSLVARGARADDPPTFADRGDAAVDDDDRAIGFLLNPFRAALGVFGLEGDFVLAPRLAVAVDIAAVHRDHATDVALTVGVLFFPVRGAFHGMYLEPRTLYVRPYEEPVSTVDWRKDAVAFGGAAGWQWTWDYGLSVRLGAGTQYYLGAAVSSSGALRAAVALGSDRVELIVDASLGWVF
jgi:hypothetical protein